jgi:mannose-6-phosphate isomerase-like protein (cupin superfamily)
MGERVGGYEVSGEAIGAGAPAGVPHRFFNSGSVRLRQVDIHESPRFETEWLDGRSE